jgi:hypothetical protein
MAPPCSEFQKHGFVVGARLILIGEEVQLTAWKGQPRVWRLGDLEWTATVDKNDVVSMAILQRSE